LFHDLLWAQFRTLRSSTNCVLRDNFAVLQCLRRYFNRFLTIIRRCLTFWTRKCSQSTAVTHRRPCRELLGPSNQLLARPLYRLCVHILENERKANLQLIQSATHFARNAAGASARQLHETVWAPSGPLLPRQTERSTKPRTRQIAPEA